MEIILLKDIATLGYKDDLVQVKSGYARNFLIPQKIAIVGNGSNKKALAERVKQQELKFKKLMEELNAVADKLKDGAIKIGAKTGTSGKIFGSVTTLQISEAIKEKTGATIDRRKIKIQGDIKTVGAYKADVELHRDLKTEIEFEVVAE